VLVVSAPEADASPLRDVGAEVFTADSIESALAELGRRGITSIFLEGGQTLAAAFAEVGQVDEARVFVAPVLLAGGTRTEAVDPGATDTLIATRFKEW
jgi:diaminohydroxyphosphoribosylaminopyrimidine deaminase/5-amino-6-(5-phosphoribosylamino)uracil reductase